MIATYSNMCVRRSILPDDQKHELVAISVNDTGEVYSADPGDYFTMGADDYLTDAEGDPMHLALRVPERFEFV